MDQNQPWHWRQQRQDGYPSPMPNVPNPFGMPYQALFNPDMSRWNQPAPQQSPFHTAQPHQQNHGRGRGQGDFYQPDPRNPFAQDNAPPPQNGGRRWGAGDSYRPAPPFGPPQPSWQSTGWPRGQGNFSQPGPQRSAPPANHPRQWGNGDDRDGGEHPPPRRQRRRRASASRGDPPRPRRAPAPTWRFAETEQPLPFPMDNPALGPFGSTRAVRQNNALNREVNNFASLPDGQLAGANNSTPSSQPRGKKAKGIKRSRPHTSLPPSADSNPPSRDPISAPSAESGGIPSPSPSYLSLAHHPPTRLPSPQPILVVIDLNGTLLHRPNKRAASRFVERPLARAFLTSCLAKHHVVIWSSARPENVARMCAQLLPPHLLSRVVAVWGRDRFGLTATDYGRRTQCYKRLTKLWADPAVGGAHPHAQAGPERAEAEAETDGEGGRAGLWTQANTVLIDDSVEKARSEPYNAVTLPEFAGNVDEQPQVLRLVEEYLDELAWQADVSAYIRVNPFSMGGLQPANVAEEE